ncbi:MAG: hypothetical protein FJW35_16620, partial [Acidobacteria bacterium]|nr:hypothetical protein [Acidobacteriota bacterium]
MNELLEEILGEVAGHPPAREVLESARGRTETRISVCEAAVPLMAAAAYRILGGPLVLAVPTDAARTAGDVAAFLPGEAFHLPGGALAGEWFRPSDETVGQRFRAAGALAAGQVVIAGVEALLGGVPSALPEGWPITLAAGEGVDLESLMERLVEGGYDREYTVEGWGRFALRGGILDIFPSTGERPVRVELVGETIESLREFNIVTQRSADHVERLEIFPAVETEGRVAQRVSRPTVLAVNPGMIAAKALEFLQDLGLEAREEPLLDSWGAVMGLDTLGGLESGGPTFPGGPVREFAGDLASAAAEWKRLVASGERVYLLLDGPGQVQRAGELWAEHGGAARPPAMGVGTLSRGFAVPDLGITVFTSSDLVGRPRARRAARRASSGAPVASYAELEVDGYVVQADEGIGIFRGLVSREVLGVTREYLL